VGKGSSLGVLHAQTDGCLEAALDAYMKVILVSTDDISGGAARATYRLHQGLLRLGEDSRVVARHKASSDERVIPVPTSLEAHCPEGAFFGEIIQRRYVDEQRSQVSNTLFSYPYPGFDISRLPEVLEADVINLHWVARFQSPATLHKLLRLGKPVVWTLHDQWAFTGGCHYTAGCQKYIQDCASCPQLSEDPFNMPASILSEKIQLFKNADLTIVTPSQWLANCARQSKLFKSLRIEAIPNSLDVDSFKPVPKDVAKESLGLSQEVLTLLFGVEDSSEARKGFALLMEAIRHCLSNERFRQAARSPGIRLLCFGRLNQDIAALPIPATTLGYLETDEDLRRAYSAADLFVLPSLEDNLPNTVLESMSCGTPVISFDIGGLPDVITNRHTGLLVPVGNSQLLGDAILSALCDSSLRATMGENGRNLMAGRFNLSVQATRYRDLFRELQIHGRGTSRKSSWISQKDSVPEEICLGGDSATGWFCCETLEKVLLRSLKQHVTELRLELETSEADRAARLAAIQTLQRQLGETQNKMQLVEDEYRGRLDSLEERLRESEADRPARLAAMEKRLRKSEAASDSERARYQQTILDLEQKVAVLSTTGAALRRLVKVTATPLGLLDLLRRHRPKAERLYRQWRDRRQASQTGELAMGEAVPDAVDLPTSQTNTLINSPLVEAFVAARSAGIGASDQCLEASFQLGNRWHRVLCLHPGETDLQAAYMMARAGARVECVGCDLLWTILACPSLMIGTIPFLEWLKEQRGGILADYDGLILGEQLDEPAWRQLTGRFGDSTALLINPIHAPRIKERKLLGPQANTPEGYLLYSELPFTWQSPLPVEDLLAISANWPWSDDPLPVFPERMPSGRPWPRISVITVTQNQGQFIEETLRSILGQGYPNLEYIVLDRRSTDNTFEILGRYQGKLAYCKSELDNGQADALNKGFQRASGDILAWLNSDDRYLPWTLLRVALAFDQFPDADLVVGGCALVLHGEKTPRITHHTSMPLGQVVPLPVECLLDFDGSWQKGAFFYQPGVFWKQEIWQKAGNRVDTSLYYGTAYELWVRLAFNGVRILHVPDTLAMVRVHPNQEKAGENLTFLPELRQVNARLKKEWDRA
jgi:glycosyltransferase involved in cell wall biosynthesis/GT2 family glycosyltransferase